MAAPSSSAALSGERAAISSRLSSPKKARRELEREDKILTTNKFFLARRELGRWNWEKAKKAAFQLIFSSFGKVLVIFVLDRGGRFGPGQRASW